MTNIFNTNFSLLKQDKDIVREVTQLVDHNTQNLFVQLYGTTILDERVLDVWMISKLTEERLNNNHAIKDLLKGSIPITHSCHKDFEGTMNTKKVQAIKQSELKMTPGKDKRKGPKKNPDILIEDKEPLHFSSANISWEDIYKDMDDISFIGHNKYLRSTTSKHEASRNQSGSKTQSHTQRDDSYAAPCMDIDTEDILDQYAEITTSYAFTDMGAQPDPPAYMSHITSHDQMDVDDHVIVPIDKDLDRSKDSLVTQDPSIEETSQSSHVLLFEPEATLDKEFRTNISKQFLLYRDGSTNNSYDTDYSSDTSSSLDSRYDGTDTDNPTYSRSPFKGRHKIKPRRKKNFDRFKKIRDEIKAETRNKWNLTQDSLSVTALTAGPSRHDNPQRRLADNADSDIGATYDAYIIGDKITGGDFNDEKQSIMHSFLFQMRGFKYSSWDRLNNGTQILVLHFDSLPNLKRAVHHHNNNCPTHKIAFRRHYKLKDQYIHSRDFKIIGIKPEDEISKQDIKNAVNKITRKNDCGVRNKHESSTTFRFSVNSQLSAQRVADCWFIFVKGKKYHIGPAIFTAEDFANRKKFRAFFKGIHDQKILEDYSIITEVVEHMGGKDFFVYQNEDKAPTLEIIFDNESTRDNACIRTCWWKSFKITGVPSDIGWLRREEWLTPILKLKSNKETQRVHNSTLLKDVDDKLGTKNDSEVALINKELVVLTEEVNNRDTGTAGITNMNNQLTCDHEKLRAYENGQISMESLTKEERKEARKRKKILAEQEESENSCYNQIIMELDKETVIDAEEKTARLEEQARIELNDLAELIQKQEDRERKALEQEQVEKDRLVAECSNKQLEKIAKFRKNARRNRFTSSGGNGR